MPTSSPWFLRSPFCVEAVVERKRADAATAVPSSPEELELSWVTVQVRQRERAAAAPARPPPRSSALSKRADRPWAPQSRVEEGKWGRSWRRSERSCIFATPPAPNCSKEEGPKQLLHRSSFFHRLVQLQPKQFAERSVELYQTHPP